MNDNIKKNLEKLKRWFLLMPYGTKTIFITILAFYILKIFWSEEVDDTCINPDIMWSNIITSIPRYILHSFVHANILHIVFNSIALIHFSSNFEEHVGSVLLMYIVLVFTILIAVLYSFSAKILSIFFISKWMESCTIGISGVLFSFITIESLQNETIKNIFREIEIPSKYNPWILLVVTQLLWPKASFLGHLSGIAIGYLYNMGLLDKLMPTHPTISEIEKNMPFGDNYSRFITHPGGNSLSDDPIINNPPIINIEPNRGRNNQGYTQLIDENDKDENDNNEKEDNDSIFTDTDSESATPVVPIEHVGGGSSNDQTIKTPIIDAMKNNGNKKASFSLYNDINNSNGTTSKNPSNDIV